MAACLQARRLGLLAVGAAALAACGAAPAAVNPASGAAAATSAAAAVTAAPDGAVHVSVADFRVTPATASAKAGAVKIVVANAGASTHEFVVFKSDLDAAGLPYNATTQKIDEQGAGVEHFDPEAENIAPGSSKQITVTLRPGRYVFVCNIAGHYRLGMHAAFEVKG